MLKERDLRQITTSKASNVGRLLQILRGTKDLMKY